MLIRYASFMNKSEFSAAVRHAGCRYWACPGEFSVRQSFRVLPKLMIIYDFPRIVATDWSLLFSCGRHLKSVADTFIFALTFLSTPAPLSTVWWVCPQWTGYCGRAADAARARGPGKDVTNSLLYVLQKNHSVALCSISVLKLLRSKRLSMGPQRRRLSNYCI